jgi:hypothetical protein
MRLVRYIALFQQAQEIADFPASPQLLEDVAGVAPHCGNVDEFEQGVVFLLEILVLPLGRAHAGLSDLHLILAFFLLVTTPRAWALAITLAFPGLTDLACSGDLLSTGSLLGSLKGLRGTLRGHNGSTTSVTFDYYE